MRQNEASKAVISVFAMLNELIAVHPSQNLINDWTLHRTERNSSGGALCESSLLPAYLWKSHALMTRTSIRQMQTSREHRPELCRSAKWNDRACRMLHWGPKEQCRSATESKNVWNKDDCYILKPDLNTWTVDCFYLIFLIANLMWPKTVFCIVLLN